MLMNCSKCIFANTAPPMSGGPYGTFQTGCKTGRLKKFIEMGKAELPINDAEFSLEEQNNFYNISTFCNHSRDYAWVKTIGKQGASHEELIEQMRHEVKSSFGIVVNMGEEGEEELKQTASSIKNACYPHDKITVIISAEKKNLHTQIYLNVVEDLRNSGINCTLFFHASGFDKSEVEREAFTKVFDDYRTHLCKINAGQVIDTDMMGFVQDVLNEDLETVVCFEDEVNGVIFISKNLVNNVYLNYQDYDLMAEDMVKESIIQKNYKKYETKK